MKTIKTLITAFLAICATSCVNSELTNNKAEFIERLIMEYKS